jgi:hypothetical protein
MDNSTGSTLLDGFDNDGYTSTEDPNDNAGYTSTEGQQPDDNAGYTSTESLQALTRRPTEGYPSTEDFPVVKPLEGDCGYSSTEEMKVETQTPDQDIDTRNLDTQMVLPILIPCLGPCVCVYISTRRKSWILFFSMKICGICCM